MAHLSQSADRLARTDRQRVRRGGVGETIHQFWFAEMRAAGKHAGGRRVQLVRVFHSAGRSVIQRADTSDKQVLHSERADRLQQYWQRVRVAVRGVSGLLSAEESRPLPESERP